MSKPDFIFVDDEEINNMISRITVEASLGKGTQTLSFVNALTVFNYLTTFTQRSPEVQTILLLDFNMPLMSGWEFLENFDQLSMEIKNAIRIYILSSSVDFRDRQRSYANKNVVDYLVKPLALDMVNRIARSVMSDRYY